jgi:hypothetical protein
MKRSTGTRKSELQLKKERKKVPWFVIKEKKMETKGESTQQQCHRAVN